MIYFFLFSCYFISVSCTAVWVAQRVCVYEWTIIYISGIMIANIYCMYIVILYGKVCMVKINFVLIVWWKGGPTTVPSLFLLMNFLHRAHIWMWIKRRWLVGYSWSSHGNYNRKPGHNKYEITHMRTINYRQEMAESMKTLFVNNVRSTTRECGLIKAYPYVKRVYKVLTSATEERHFNSRPGKLHLLRTL
jgi:hypothetical protein